MVTEPSFGKRLRAAELFEKYRVNDCRRFSEKTVAHLWHIIALLVLASEGKVAQRRSC